jgi:hypothetical protein
VAQTTKAANGASSSAATSTATPARKTAKSGSAAPSKTVSASDIAAAKASGQVWVNTETKVYHKNDKWYGATKSGKFMSEQDAIKAGYHLAKTGGQS